MRLTQFQFRSRFTTAEKVNIELASLDQPSAEPAQRAQAATLRVLMADMSSAEFVDLTLPATIQGVMALESFGLIAPGRAAEILDAAGAEPLPPENGMVSLTADQLAFDGKHRVAEASTYEVTALVPVYLDGDQSKTVIGLLQANYIATGENL